MFHDWGEFYLVIGGAAAVLIGLIFVVVTLMQDKPRSTMISGARLYMGPIVLDLSLVLVLTAAALTPEIGGRQFAAIAAAVAAWGLYRGVQSTIGIRSLQWNEDPPHWTDKWWYGVAPTLLFLALGAVAGGFWSGAHWAVPGVAAVDTGILLVAIRNEWDLVTWLAPKPDA